MNNLRWRSAARLAAIASLLPLLLGCFKYKETITVLPGGNGDVVITASIPEKTASTYRDPTKVEGEVPPPVSKGLIEQFMLGSKDVRVAESDVALNGDNWEYNIKIEFGSIDALSQVRYFKERHLKKEFTGGKKLKVSEDITPTLLLMARNQAKVMVDNPYAGPFLAVVDSEDFHGADDASMTYEIVLPGAEPEAATGGKTEPKPDDATSASWTFAMSDLLQLKSPPNLYLTVSLPGEHGAMAVVITLLLASLVGILAPAIRLIMVKSKGAA